jgi:hypothetical protein
MMYREKERKREQRAESREQRAESRERESREQRTEEEKIIMSRCNGLSRDIIFSIFLRLIQLASKNHE